jgi:hypothetical protein
VELSLSLSEAAEGCTKRLSFDAYVFCDSCGEWPQKFSYIVSFAFTNIDKPVMARKISCKDT